MTDSISLLAERANHAYAAQTGFVRCTVESERPPVLAFDFTSAEAAQAFMFELELQGVQARMAIPADRPETVLQYR